jgi:ABC-2 type transport system permease protein
MLLTIPFRTLVTREVERFWMVATQTLLAPAMSATLYLFIFGYSLGSRFPDIHGHPYIQFIVPGLITMGLINNSFQNTASSLLIAKYEGSIVDILTAPISYVEMTVAFALGGMARGLAVGLLVLAVSWLFTPLPLAHAGYLLTLVILASLSFSLLGLLAAIWAERFDEMAMLSTFILLPLTYLGGVFYSLELLPPFWRRVSLFNPLLYMIDGTRYGFLGVSDVNPSLSLGLILAVAGLLFTTAVLVLKSGYRLRK